MSLTPFNNYYIIIFKQNVRFCTDLLILPFVFWLILGSLNIFHKETYSLSLLKYLNNAEKAHFLCFFIIVTARFLSFFLSISIN